MERITLTQFDAMCNNRGLKYHHSATVRGYISRKTPVDVMHVQEYSGKFGNGIKVFYPRYDTTQFVTVDYYIA